ncbi:MAG: peptidoglycan DD-metalloendopeptidase family protein, partial [Anaerolineae bacterium]
MKYSRLPDAVTTCIRRYHRNDLRYAVLRLVMVILVTLQPAGSMASNIHNYPSVYMDGDTVMKSSAVLISDDQLVFHPNADKSTIESLIRDTAPLLIGQTMTIGKERYPLADVVILSAQGRDYDINPFILWVLLVATGSVEPETASLDGITIALPSVKSELQGLPAQLSRVAKALSRNFYVHELGLASDKEIHFQDGSALAIPKDINSGTYALQMTMAEMGLDQEHWQLLVGGHQGRFLQVYDRLIGDPMQSIVKYSPAVTPILRKPFNGGYRNYDVNSWFDHESPTYAANGSIVIYNGDRRTDPANEQCTFGFNCYDGHDGIDYNTGTAAVVAAASGTATVYRDWNFGDGCPNVNAVIIDHGSGYKTKYWHLSLIDIDNGPVTEGDQIGLSGSTGCSTGPHLHFGVTLNNQKVDPYGWKGRYADPWSATSTCLWRDDCGATLPPSSNFGGTGGIVKSGSGQAVGGAFVSLVGGNYTLETATNRDGVYMFPVAPTGSVRISAYRNREFGTVNHVVQINSFNYAPEIRFNACVSLVAQDSSNERQPLDCGVPPTCPTSGGVILYKDWQYQCANEGEGSGWVRRDSTGWQNVGGFNDRASSVRVPSGWSVKLFEHGDRGGGWACRNSNDDNFGGNQFNNGASLN